MSEYVLGVDPGKTGALCFLPLAGGPLVYLVVPEISGTKEIDLSSIYRFAHPYITRTAVCAIEDVHSVFGSSAKSNFQFGRALGNVEMLPVVFGVPCVKVQPKKWQATAWEGITPVKKPKKTMRKNKKTGKYEEHIVNKTDTKATSLLAARRLFPNETFLATKRSSVPHDGAIDAALIAYWARLNCARS